MSMLTLHQILSTIVIFLPMFWLMLKDKNDHRYGPFVASSLIFSLALIDSFTGISYHGLRKEALKAGVAEYVTDSDGRTEFRFKKIDSSTSK